MSSYKSITLLAVPIILVRITFSLATIAGNLIAANLGTKVLAAEALTTTIYMWVFSFAAGNLNSISPLVAHEYAKKNYIQIFYILIQGLYYATILGIVALAIFYNITWILKIFNEPPELITLAEQYYSYFAFGVFPMLWSFTLQEVLIGCSHQQIISIYGIIRMLLSVFLAYALVLGKFGLPAMGFAGLGFSQLIASTLSCLCFIAYLSWRYSTHIQRYYTLKLFIPTQQLLKMIRFGIPIGVQASSEILTIMIATLLIGRFGIAALASQQIILQYLLLFSMITFGFAQAVASRISNLLAKNEYQLIYYTIRKSLLIIITIASLSGLIYIFASHYLIELYIYRHKLQAQEFFDLATHFFYIIAIYQMFEGVRAIINGILRGYGNSFVAMLTGMSSSWIISIPMIILLITYSKLGAIIIPISLTSGVGIGTIILSFYASIKLFSRNR